MNISKGVVFVGLLLGVFFSIQSEAKNLHIIDENPKNGFAIYRMGKPSSTDMKELCQLGIQEVLVLSGDAENHEIKYKKDCPKLKVFMNIDQKVNTPVTSEFIRTFEAWVEEAQITGKKIAFRCSCGCHRTGRIAAYYQMKYQGVTSDEAIEVMNELGKYMFVFPSLPKQVKAMEQYLDSQTCTYAPYCVDGKGSLWPFFPYDSNYEDSARVQQQLLFEGLFDGLSEEQLEQL